MVGVRHVIDLPFDVDAPAVARAFTQELVADWPAARADDVLLCVSEIVTNGLVHAAPALALELEVDTDAVTVAVVDGGDDLTIEVGDPGIDRPRGRGLYLVSLLASAWGSRIDRATSRKTVWCVVDRDPVPGRAHRAGATA